MNSIICYRSLGLASALGTMLISTGVAFAGSCPPDQILRTPFKPEEAIKLADVPEKNMERHTLHSFSIKGWRGTGDLYLRTRRLIIHAGGFVPTHYHGDRPSIVYIVSGEIWENNNTCKVPILHKAGDSTPEFGPAHGHWWQNKTDKDVVIISSDVIPPEQKDDDDM